MLAHMLAPCPSMQTGAMHGLSPFGPPVARMLEVLWLAGYRPSIYPRAWLPALLRPAADAPVFAEPDPLALHDAAHPQHGQRSGLVHAYECLAPPGPACA